MRRKRASLPQYVEDWESQDELERELINAQRWLWCVLRAAGGTVVVPKYVFVAAPDSFVVERLQDAEGNVTFNALNEDNTIGGPV